MEVVILQAFVSLMLVGGMLLLFAFSIKQRDHEHTERLALLPMEEDEPAGSARGSNAASDGAPGSAATSVAGDPATRTPEPRRASDGRKAT